MSNNPTPETDLKLFCEAVEAAGLGYSISAGCWRIMDGARYRIVYCWPGLPGGFRFRAGGCDISRRDTVAEAIELAGPPKQETVAETVDRPVGMFQAALRWFRKRRGESLAARKEGHGMGGAEYVHALKTILDLEAEVERLRKALLEVQSELEGDDARDIVLHLIDVVKGHLAVKEGES